jgi:DNA invertase Pin-like site-specific DNA recombinase
MNCLLYARVSTDKQAQKELSIPAQLDAMKQHARSNDWKVIGHFVDRGESARTANRPELQRLIQQCKVTKGVDVVLVHKIDRLARNLIDYATIKAILKQKGIRLVSVSEPFDDNSIGHLLENIIASISEWYSANLGDEIRKANMAKLKKGEWPHKPPVGYKSVKGDNNRIAHVPDETMAPLVRQAFELFSTGNYSLKNLSEAMFDRGLTTRYGKMYSEENTKRILSRDFYIGRITWNNKIYAGKHQPIVPKDLFYRVQEVLKNRSADTGEKGRLEFLLRGVAYCRACNRRLTGEIHPRGSYYRCLPHVNQPRCGERYIPVKFLDGQLAALYERLQPQKEFLELLKAEMHEIAKQRKRPAERELGALKRTIAETEKKEIRLLDEMLAERVPRGTYEKMEKAYRVKREQAEARLAQLEVDYDDPLDFLDKCAVVAGMLAYLHHRFNFEQRKNLVRAVFHRIDVQDRAIVGVELNPPFSFFFDDSIRRLFEDHPAGGTKQEVFEQIVRFTLSNEYARTKETICRLAQAASNRT